MQSIGTRTPIAILKALDLSGDDFSEELDWELFEELEETATGVCGCKRPLELPGCVVVGLAEESEYPVLQVDDEVIEPLSVDEIFSELDKLLVNTVLADDALEDVAGRDSVLVVEDMLLLSEIQ